MVIKSVRHLFAGLVLAILPMASLAFVSVGVSINIAPPALPVYVQPPLPAVGYIWTPGYWAYGDDDYYWVPGTWVLAPSPGLLWTPGYWGWIGDGYAWHAGYWGPHVGFYGGVNYGYGYGGVGFEGGYWRGDSFYYNRSVANFGNTRITNVYNTTVVNNITVNRVSYNGGPGGINARPSPHELMAAHDRHIEFTSAQREHEHMASTNHDLRASVNGGKPRIAATARPAVFSGRGVVAARAAGGPVNGIDHGGASGPTRGGEARGGDVHGGDVHANRTDRPPGATGSAIHSSPGGAGGAGGAGPRAGRSNGGNSGGGARHIGGSEHATQPRNDRPPMQHSGGSAQIQHPSRGERFAPHGENGPGPQNAAQIRSPRDGGPGGRQPHFHSGGQPHFQGDAQGGAQPHAQGGPGGGQPGVQRGAEPRGQPQQPRGQPQGREHEGNPRRW